MVRHLRLKQLAETHNILAERVVVESLLFVLPVSYKTKKNNNDKKICSMYIVYSYYI
jgi:hypothetical protein